MRLRVGLLVGCLFALLAAPSHAGAIGMQAVGTFNAPIFVTAPPGDSRLFVVERGGTIQGIDGGATTEFLDISAMTTVDGERGLLSMAFDPNYASNGLFYVFYTGDGTDSGGTLGDIHVDEFRVSSNPNVADPASRREVLALARNTGASNHNGGQLQFGKDGFLYVSVGDAATSANAQSLANPHGKILRIDPHGAGDGDYGIPASNPFPASATPEIWSLGLRNPYRFSFDSLTGDIAIGDVGASSFEEIDHVPAAAGLGGGANYGWPDCEGFQGSCPGTTLPVFAYAHSDPCNALIGGYVYRGSRAPELFGRYLYTDNCHPGLRSLQLATPLAVDDRSEGLALPSGPVSFGEDADCDLYVAGGDTVQRIVGSAASAAPGCPSAAPPTQPSDPITQPSDPITQPSDPIAKRNRCKRRGERAKSKRCKKYKARFGFATAATTSR